MSNPVVIQGKNAVLSFKKEDYVPFVCAQDCSLSITADMLETRTVGGGVWETGTYEKLSFALTLSGVIVFADDSHWSGPDFVLNMFNFTTVDFRLALTDDAGTIKSFQGFLNVQSIALAYGVGKVLTGDFTLPGSGELKYFTGLIPCDSTVSNIVITGETDPDGNITVTYDFTNSPYQVRYRVDGTGNYIYALIGETIAIDGNTLGSHIIEIIPVCSNGYDGDGDTATYNITTGLTCASVVTDITLGTLTAGPVYTGSPTTYKYSVDGGTFITIPIASFAPISGLSVGSHTIEMVPICANGVEGTGFTKSFSVASQPAQSPINFILSSYVGGNSLQIYVDGILNTNLVASGTGSIMVATGAVVRGVLNINTPVGSHGTLLTQDTTLITTLDTRNGIGIQVLQYAFTANGDTYAIQGTITP